MDKKILSKRRSEIIEKFINLECLINAIISQHYFQRVTFPFVSEVLWDEYCSFALKRRILEKIIVTPDKQKIDKLNRLNTIRNYFAHCGQEILEGSAPPGDDKQGWVPDPRKPTTRINFESLYSEFTESESDVIKYLFEIFQKKGGVTVREG